MILSSRNKIRLSKTLHAQTTPYPRMNIWGRRVILVLVLSAVAGIYVVSRPNGEGDLDGIENGPKEILGEQNPPPVSSKGPVELELYTVKRGDTLFNVSQKYGLSWQTLAEINNLSEPYLLKIGQQLTIPTN